MGAWIETAVAGVVSGVKSVAPYVGAWIETVLPPSFLTLSAVAPYVGLKLQNLIFSNVFFRRTLRGCVD